MEDGCKSCKFNIIDESPMMSPGSLMINTIYICDNIDSGSFNERMGVLTNTQTGSTIDSRENRTCEKHSK